MEEKVKQLGFFHLLIVIAIGSIVPFCLLQTQLSQIQLENQPLYSTMLIIGTMIALTYTVVFLQKGKEIQNWRLYLIGMGLLSMGLLQGASASLYLGNETLFLQSIGGLVGALFFAVACLRICDERYLASNTFLFPIVISIVSIPIIGFVLLFPEALPSFVKDTRIANPCMALNLITGVLFLSASSYFLVNFYRNLDLASSLAGITSLFFGISSIMLNYTFFWQPGWWFVNSLRFIAYLVVMGLVSVYYSKILSDVNFLVSRNEKIQNELRKDKEWMSLIVDTAFEPFVSFDSNGLIMDWNIKAMQIFGWSREEAINKKISDLILPKKLRGIFEQSIETYLLKGEGVLFDNKIGIQAISRNGQELPLQMVIRPVQFNGNTSFIAFFSDTVKKRKIKADGLLNYQHMISQVDSILRLYRADGDCTYASPNSYKHLGYNPDELLGRNGYEFCHPEDQEYYISTYAKLLKSSLPHKVTYRYRRMDGNYNWLEETLQCLQNGDNGTPKEVLSIARITGVAISDSTNIKNYS